MQAREVKIMIDSTIEVTKERAAHAQLYDDRNMGGSEYTMISSLKSHIVGELL